MHTLFSLVLLGASFVSSSYAIDTGAAAPEFTLKDVDGKSHSLSGYRGKIVAIEWLNFGCPFVKKHYESKNIPSLQEKYAAKNVVWLSIVSSAAGRQGHYLPKEMKEVAASRGYALGKATILYDTDGKVGKAYGAKTTPHFFLVDQKGTLRYQGAIDDKPSTDVEDVKGARNYVSESLDLLLAGKAPKEKSTKPYGCSVKYED